MQNKKRSIHCKWKKKLHEMYGKLLVKYKGQSRYFPVNEQWKSVLFYAFFPTIYIFLRNTCTCLNEVILWRSSISKEIPMDVSCYEVESNCTDPVCSRSCVCMSKRQALHIILKCIYICAVNHALYPPNAFLFTSCCIIKHSEGCQEDKMSHRLKSFTLMRPAREG